MGHPCGSGDSRVERGMAAYTYLTENFACGPLSVKHYHEAMRKGETRKVAQYVDGTHVSCGSTWCWPQTFQTTPISKRLDSFRTALKNGFISPQYIIERNIADNPSLRHLFRKTRWTCGWQSVSSRTGSSQSYPTFSIQTNKVLNQGELDSVKNEVLKMLSGWSGKKFDPRRVIVRNGPAIERTICETDKPLERGRYQTHYEYIPTVIILISPPACNGEV